MTTISGNSASATKANATTMIYNFENLPSELVFEVFKYLHPDLWQVFPFSKAMKRDFESL